MPYICYDNYCDYCGYPLKEKDSYRLDDDSIVCEECYEASKEDS